MADSVEKVLEERREEKAKSERSRMRLREIRAAVDPVLQSMSSEEREAFGSAMKEDMVQHLQTLRRETETLAWFEPEELRKYL